MIGLAFFDCVAWHKEPSTLWQPSYCPTFIKNSPIAAWILSWPIKYPQSLCCWHSAFWCEQESAVASFFTAKKGPDSLFPGFCRLWLSECQPRLESQTIRQDVSWPQETRRLMSNHRKHQIPWKFQNAHLWQHWYYWEALKILRQSNIRCYIAHMHACSTRLFICIG